ncbi:hypothetical protein MYP_4102 [Sporocytophaga myxococcoides]|uniref:Outer membrane protein beta-barrel domain-containing protein n=1 Tax=Sporocytophaga myxococcoides TaxID=153721 RepID=A0A098LKL7_9BACT|nr:hypothetical protein [Sporocytophaga myxococcoides]GAL86872.1 hypothetical protein MYP_4102 [Sporocytophaga myxococcoides]
MKRFGFVLWFFLIAISSVAGDQLVGLTSRVKGRDMFNDGVYLHFGIGLPRLDYLGKGRLFQGIQPSFEFGSQHMLSKGSNLAIGLNISWVTIATSIRDGEDVFGWDLNLGLIRFGPMLSAKLDENTAFDFYFNVSPTAKFNFFSYDDQGYAYLYYGALWVPGLKFRHQKLVVGAEVNFGTLFIDDLDKEDDPVYKKASYFNPKLFIGLKF